MADFGEKHGRRQLGKRVAKAEQEAAAHEDAERATSTLHDGASNHDDTANDDRYSAAEAIGEDGDNGDGCDAAAADLVEGAEQTKEGSFGIAESLRALCQILIPSV